MREEIPFTFAQVVLQAISEVLEIPRASLRGPLKARTWPTSHARRYAYRLLREAGYSYPQIGRALRLHHTSVIKGLQKLEKQLREDIRDRAKLSRARALVEERIAVSLKGWASIGNGEGG